AVAIFVLRFRFVEGGVFFVGPPPRIIAAAIDVVLNVRLLDRLAKEVARFDRELHLLADLRKLLRRGNGDFVFGLLVFLHLEVFACAGAGSSGDYAILAERRAAGDIDRAAESPTRSQLQIGVQNLAAVWIFNCSLDRAGRNFVTALTLSPQDASEV